MKHIDRAACVLAAYLLVSCAPDPEPIDYALSARWLDLDCPHSTGAGLADSIRDRGERIVELFAGAYANGATPGRVDSSAMRDWLQYRRVLVTMTSGDSTLFVRSPFAMVGSDSARFVLTRRREFVNSYRSRALVGLALIGSARARTELQAATADQELGSIARALLDSIQGGKPLPIN